MAKMDLPPDFVFETDTTNKLPPNDASDSERSSSSDEETPDDAARGGRSYEEKGVKRKHNKVVTFANEPNHLQQQGEDDEETEEQKYMRLRYKRSGSLPSIELNRELARKIRRMLKDEENNAEDTLNQLTDSLKLSAEIDKTTSEVKYEYEFVHGQTLQVRLGDITDENVDVMVNEANSNLVHNAGISGLLSQKGGRDVQTLSDRWIREHGPVPPGHVAVTESGSLPCKWLIHAVGPIWRGGNSGEDTELFDALWNSLVWASKLQAKSIAVPLVGAGFLGFQKERCAYLLVDAISKFFRKFPKSTLQEIRIVNHNPVITESVVFEMVGKFTAGCDTSESERDTLSDDELDEEEYEEEEEEYEEEEEDVDADVEVAVNGDGADGTTSPRSSINRKPNVAKSPKSVIKEHVDPSWMPMWRRQSIA